MLPKICIPSYKRPGSINLKTLRFLKSVDYPVEQIYIFCATDSEVAAYTQTCPDYQIILGVPGLMNQRNFISDWLSEDEIYISLDDDITGIKSIDKSFIDIVRLGVRLLETREAGLFGILPKDDTRAFKDDTTEHLSFIIGCFFICRNHKEIRLKNIVAHDYELSILYYIKYKKLFRYRGAGVITKYLGTAAGDQNIKERKSAAVSYLLETYPTLCKYRDKKGEPDIQLLWRATI